MMKPVVIVVGTRPEGIKLIPVYWALKKTGLPVLLCATSQHDTLLSSVFSLFQVQPDIDLKVMKPGQDLFYLTAITLEKMKEVITRYDPRLLIVQGDTTSAFAASLAGFYAHIPIAHVEAGLRTNDLYEPFPEELNRRLITLISRYHFAPTAGAASQVLAQGAHRDTVFCTGNTVVDALFYIRDLIEKNALPLLQPLCDFVESMKKAKRYIAVLTLHRRESFSGGIVRALRAVKEALLRYENFSVIYPHHPNPAVQAALAEVGLLSNERLFLTEPISYQDMVYALSSCSFLITDSGGLQEEAASLSKVTLVLRDTTERVESIWTGCARLVGTNEQLILREIEQQIVNPSLIPARELIYGDGHAADRIAEIIAHALQRDEIFKRAEEQGMHA